MADKTKAKAKAKRVRRVDPEAQASGDPVVRTPEGFGAGATDPAPAGDAAISAGPMPLVAQSSIDLTLTGFAPSSTVRVTVSGARDGVRQLKTDPFGRAQTSVIPIAGRLVVSAEGDGIKVDAEFDVAEQQGVLDAEAEAAAEEESENPPKKEK